MTQQVQSHYQSASQSPSHSASDSAAWKRTVNIPVNVLGKAAENGPKTWALATRLGELAGVPGSWL